MSKHKALQVVIIDDSKTFRNAVRTWLDHSLKFEWVGDIIPGEMAVRLVERSQPDLVLIEATSKVSDGFEWCRRIKKVSNAEIIILSVHETNSAKNQAKEVGAIGFISKHEFDKELTLLFEQIQQRRTRHVPMNKRPKSDIPPEHNNLL